MEKKPIEEHFSEFLDKTRSLLDRLDYLCVVGLTDASTAQSSIDIMMEILKPARKELDAIADRAGVVD
jgi:hypothetical protein